MADEETTPKPEPIIPKDTQEDLNDLDERIRKLEKKKK
jgi:hypothetical protein